MEWIHHCVYGVLLTCFVFLRRWSFRVSNPPPTLEWRPSDGISQEATPGCFWVFHQAWCERNRLHFRMKVTVTLSYTRVIISLHFVLPLCLFFTGEILHLPWQVTHLFLRYVLMGHGLNEVLDHLTGGFRGTKHGEVPCLHHNYMTAF